MTGAELVAFGALLGLGSAGLTALAVGAVRRSRDLGTPADRATFGTLHTASLAAPRCARG